MEPGRDGNAGDAESILYVPLLQAVTHQDQPEWGDDVGRFGLHVGFNMRQSAVGVKHKFAEAEPYVKP